MQRRTARRRGGRRKTTLVQTPGELHTPENYELRIDSIFTVARDVFLQTLSINILSEPVLFETSL